MLTLIDSKKAPPGGWRWVDPDTGYEYNRQYLSYKDLTKHIFSYRQMNNLPALSNIDETIYDWLCQQDNMETHCCPLEASPRTWGQLLTGARQVTKAAVFGLYCDSKTAEKRADMCESCPYNRFYKDDIKYYDPRVIFPLVHGRSVPNQKRLKTCSKCMCILAVKIHHCHKEIAENLDESIAAELKRDKPDCWQLKDL